MVHGGGHNTQPYLLLWKVESLLDGAVISNSMRISERPPAADEHLSGPQYHMTGQLCGCVCCLLFTLFKKKKDSVFNCNVAENCQRAELLKTRLRPLFEARTGACLQQSVAAESLWLKRQTYLC